MSLLAQGAIRCDHVFITRRANIGQEQLRPLRSASLEKDRFEVVGTVDSRYQELAEAVIDLYPNYYGENSLKLNLYGGSQKPIIISNPLPLEIETIAKEHLNRLNLYFQKRFPGKNFEFSTAEIRISNNGNFDVGHLHMDFGGFQSTLSTSTTFNKTGVGTYVVLPENIVTSTSKDGPLLPLNINNYSGWEKIPGYGVKLSSLQQTDVGETLVVYRVPGGVANSGAQLMGKKGLDRQQEAISSGAWHASPGLVESNTVRNPRRFWMGVTVIFTDRPQRSIK